jgi:ornithine lipid ester-linked acyl 2-hydroxylase
MDGPVDQEFVRELPYVRALSLGWEKVRWELDRLVGDDFIPAAVPHLYRPDGWTVAHLVSFYRPQTTILEKCQSTAHFVFQFPGVLNARFSRLLPRTTIGRHKGIQAFQRPVLRLHLGLRVPAGCGICVGDQVFLWEEGKCLGFDDAIEHHAWNRSDDPRTILLIDFDDPRLPHPTTEG